MRPNSKRTQSRVLPWFGSDATVSEQYAALLADCKHVTVPFCGGLSIVSHLVETAGEIVCNDKHSLAMNFYRVISSPVMREGLIHQLECTPFHETVLLECQEKCKLAGEVPNENVNMAFCYFVTCWMGRSGKAGTKSEFDGGLAMRWDAGGGSSPLRCQTAVRSIKDYWGPICERCSFVCADWREIIQSVKHNPKNGVYVDSTWPDAGDSYLHRFTEQDHRDLEQQLRWFKSTKVVIRYGEHPLIRSLYGAGDHWNIREITSRNQANNGVAELCITNF